MIYPLQIFYTPELPLDFINSLKHIIEDRLPFSVKMTTKLYVFTTCLIPEETCLHGKLVLDAIRNQKTIPLALFVTEMSLKVYNGCSPWSMTHLLDAALVSFDQIGKEQMLRFNEVLHQLGHLIGLNHTNDNNCLMKCTSDIEFLSQRAFELCPNCTRLLNRIIAD